MYEAFDFQDVPLPRVRFGSVEAHDDDDGVPDVTPVSLSTPSEILQYSTLLDNMSRCSSSSTICTLANGDSDFEAQGDEERVGSARPIQPGRAQGSAEPWVWVEDPQGAAAVAADADTRPITRPPRPPPPPNAAVAAHGGRMVWRPVRNTDPVVPEPAVAGPAARKRSDVLNDREDVGNIGMMFGNWGSRANNPRVQEGIDLQMKHGPANIIGLCEAEEETREVLQSAAVAADERADDLRNRQGQSYYCIRGNEAKSNMLAVRADNGTLDLLHWDRKLEGYYNAKNGNRAAAYSRTLVCRVNLHQNVGFFGREIVCAVAHLHNKVANNDKGFRKQQREYWARLHRVLVEHKVDVLMGDFNMSLWKVVPELREMGLDIVLVSWYPWKSEHGEACCDSCGIFIVGKAPGEVALKAGLDSLHNADASGILYSYHQGLGCGRSGDRTGPYDVWSLNAGPGQQLSTYLPKADTCHEKLQRTLQHSRAPAVAGAFPAQAALDAPPKGGGKGNNKGPQRLYLRMKEKRLDSRHWKTEGQNYKGSHYPLCAFTNNVGRRSEKSFVARRNSGRK